MSESRDLEAQERAALSIGDRQAAAKARARIEEIAQNDSDGNWIEPPWQRGGTE